MSRTDVSIFIYMFVCVVMYVCICQSVADRCEYLYIHVCVGVYMYVCMQLYAYMPTSRHILNQFGAHT